jgi:hypothetical protein
MCGRFLRFFGRGSGYSAPVGDVEYSQISVDGAKNKNNLRKLGQQLCVGVGSECTNAVYGIIYRKGGTLEAASVVFIDDVEMP